MAALPLAIQILQRGLIQFKAAGALQFYNGIDEHSDVFWTAYRVCIQDS